MIFTQICQAISWWKWPFVNRFFSFIRRRAGSDTPVCLSDAEINGSRYERHIKSSRKEINSQQLKSRLKDSN